MNTVNKITLALTLTLSAIAQSPATVTNSYTAKALVSDIPGVGVSTDKLLVNPWGLSKLVSPSFPEEQWWASDNGTGVSTLYNANGTKVNGFAAVIDLSDAYEGLDPSKLAIAPTDSTRSC